MKTRRHKYKIYLALFVFLLLGACAKDIEVFTGNIQGKVTDAVSGEVLQGVSVSITPSGNSKTTGSDGAFEFLDLEPKQYELQAKKEGYEPNSKTITVITGSTISGDIQLTPQKKTTGNIVGIVCDVRSDEPINGATVQIIPGGNTYTTGVDGHFEFVDLQAAKYEVLVSKVEYESFKREITVEADKSVTCDVKLSTVKKEGVLALSVNTLNFGSQSSSLPFSIRNNGNENINWNISGLEKIDWLSITPSHGVVEAGKNNAVVVTLNRNRITEYKEATIIINSEHESLPLIITAEVENKSSKIELNTRSLNFGAEYSVLSFDIKNIGNAGNVDWEINGIDVDWLTVSPMTGTTAMDKSSAVKVNIDRSKLEAGEHAATIFVSADGESLPLRISAKAEEKFHKIELDTDELDFGTETNSLSFNIKNTGNAGNADWTIKGIDVDWLTVSPMTGTTAMDKSSAVKVNIDRSKLEAGEHAATIFVSADGESLPLRISAKVEEKFHKIELDTDELDFGTETNSLSFNIKNTGNAGNADWTIKGVDVDWIRINPLSGTTAIGKSSAVKVDVDRSKLEIGNHSTTFIVEANGEMFVVVVHAEKTDNRYLRISPESLDLGTEVSKSFFVYSHNGSTSYKLLVRGNADWAYFSSTEGVLPEYVSGDINTFEMFTVEAVRDGLAPGEYGFTLIIRTEMGDYELPISMTVEETSIAGNEEIITCDDDLEFSLTSCKISGTTATLEMKVKNNGYNSTTFSISGGSGNSYAYDDQGNRYTDSYLKVFISGNYETNWDSSTEIPAGVTTKFTIKIYNVASNSAVFDCININTNKNSSLVLKNVSIEGRYPSSIPGQQTTGTVSSCCDELEFTLLDCKYGSNRTTLKFRTKNTGYENITLGISGGSANGSYAYDDDGNKYSENNVRVCLSGESETNWESRTEIPAGVMINGEITLYNVSSTATEFSNITIKTNQGNDLVFKNVKIRK